MRDIRGCRCAGKLQLLRPILDEWAKLNTSIAQRGSCPWWDTERSLVSVFAGAIWRSDGIAFEENRESKQPAAKSRKCYIGRVDLRFNYKGCEFGAEAKREWFGASGRAGIHKESAKRGVDEACRDAGKLPENESTRRIGMMFAVPIVTKGDKGNLDVRIERTIQDLLNVEADAWAWAFPKLVKTPVDEDGLYPGVFLFIKEVRST